MSLLFTYTPFSQDVIGPVWSFDYGLSASVCPCPSCIDGLFFTFLSHNCTPAKRIFFADILESACLSIRVSVNSSVRVSVYVQNISFCQSAGGGIKSHLVTAFVLSSLLSPVKLSIAQKSSSKA